MYSLKITFLNELEVISLHTVKWFGLLSLFNGISTFVDYLILIEEQ